MLALKSNTGFEVVDADELYYINGGSGSFGFTTYNEGNGTWGVKFEASWDGKSGEKHGFEVHAGAEDGKADIGGSWY